MTTITASTQTQKRGRHVSATTMLKQANDAILKPAEAANVLALGDTDERMATMVLNMIIAQSQEALAHNQALNMIAVTNTINMLAMYGVTVSAGTFISPETGQSAEFWRFDNAEIDTTPDNRVMLSSWENGALSELFVTIGELLARNGVTPRGISSTNLAKPIVSDNVLSVLSEKLLVKRGRTKKAGEPIFLCQSLSKPAMLLLVADTWVNSAYNRLFNVPLPVPQDVK